MNKELTTVETGFALRIDGTLTAENITIEEVFNIIEGLYNPDENFSIEAWVCDPDHKPNYYWAEVA